VSGLLPGAPSRVLKNDEQSLRGAKRRGNLASAEITTARSRGPRDDFFGSPYICFRVFSASDSRSSHIVPRVRSPPHQKQPKLASVCVALSSG